MNIDITENEDITIISLSGSFDLLTQKKIAEKADSLIESNDKDVEIDLSEVSYIDSSGIATLLKICKSQKEKSLGFRISKASERVKSILELSSLLEYLT